MSDKKTSFDEEKIKNELLKKSEYDMAFIEKNAEYYANLEAQRLQQKEEGDLQQLEGRLFKMGRELEFYKGLVERLTSYVG